jgi:hypothetical protein
VAPTSTATTKVAYRVMDSAIPILRLFGVLGIVLIERLFRIDMYDQHQNRGTSFPMVEENEKFFTALLSFVIRVNKAVTVDRAIANVLDKFEPVMERLFKLWAKEGNLK